MLLIALSLAWVAGIFLGSKLNLPVLSLFSALAPLPLLLFYRKQRKLLITASLCLLALGGGAIWYQASQPTVNENHVLYYNDGGTVTLKGMVSAGQDIRDKSTRLTVTVTEMDSGGGWKKVNGKVMVFVPRYFSGEYGTTLQVRGKLETPPLLGDFDYAGYLKGQGVSSIMSFPDISVIERGRGFRPLAVLHSLRQMLALKMTQVLPEPQASLAQGIILGIRSNIPPSVNDDFTRTGTTHVLAISGMNLNIVAGMFIATGIWLFGKRRYTYAWLALTATWGYTLLTGMNPPVLRAAIMLTLFLAADILGRQRSALPALAFAAAVMVGVNPFLLRDASFQLSFLATLGMVAVAPPIQASARTWVNRRLGEEGALVSTVNWVLDSLAVTVGVLLVVWPVITYYFGVFSLVAPVSTLLLTPLLSVIFITGMAAVGLSLIAVPLGNIAGWLAWLFLTYLLTVVKWTASLPAAAVNVDISPVVLWSYFVLLVLVFWLFPKRKQVINAIDRVIDFLVRIPLKWSAPPLLVLAVLAPAFAASMPDDRVHISFLDVGQGDAIHIRNGNQDILVDGGPSPRAVTLELGQKMPFWDRTIDLVILTHPHTDHLAGLVELLRRYRVKQVLYPDAASDSPLWKEWTTLIERNNIKVTHALAGQLIELGNGDLSIEVLNPVVSDIEASLDAEGVVLRVSRGKISFLLTADVPAERELELTSRRAHLESTILKVGHHGSNTSTNPEFLATVNPEVAVISVGADNDYGHPNKEVLQRLSERVGEGNIYRTDKNGTVEFITDGEKLWVKKDLRAK
ncbi:MAG: DNA internalization-related competence protein ComEC/Rec2 [Dehalococcoidia bacterium]|nr:DNA internalization-related competence protein ComEC/Rec2 [Dehalococcoidia bacterium]